jgi:hypothetical protein
MRVAENLTWLTKSFMVALDFHGRVRLINYIRKNVCFDYSTVADSLTLRRNRPRLKLLLLKAVNSG